MRSKKLRSREQNFIQSNQEPVKRSLNFGKYLYLFILAAIVISGFKWLGESLFLIKGVGFLEAETILVEAIAPGRIIEIKCAINDTISIDTPLVTLDNTWTYDTPDGQQSAFNNYYANERRIIDAESRISYLKQKITLQKEVLRKLKNGYSNAQNLYYASAITRSQFSNMENEVSQAEFDLQALQIEFGAELKKLKSYMDQHTTLGSGGNGVHPPANEVLFATKAGVVAEILKTKGEVVKPGEAIFRLLNRDEKIIRTYFTENTESLIEKGDKVNIEFENGDTAEGIVRKIYPATAAQPPEIKNKFGKVRRFIIAEIAPVNKFNSDRVFGTQVTVTARKKWFKSSR